VKTGKDESLVVPENYSEDLFSGDCDNNLFSEDCDVPIFLSKSIF
jgi:hypothetical protein